MSKGSFPHWNQYKQECYKLSTVTMAGTLQSLSIASSSNSLQCLLGLEAVKVHMPVEGSHL